MKKRSCFLPVCLRGTGGGEGASVCGPLGKRRGLFNWTEKGPLGKTYSCEPPFLGLLSIELSRSPEVCG